MRGYSFFSILYLLVSRFFTLYISKKARLIRLPVFIRNIKQISFGINFTSGVGCRFDAFSDFDKRCKISFGDNVQINDYVHIGAFENISIGNNVLIASKVFISDHNHGSYSGNIHSSPYIPPSLRPITSKPIIIEDNVWIGEFVSILSGLTVGKGSII